MSQPLNPYGNFLGNDDPQAVLSDTPRQLRDLAPHLLGEKAEHSYAPGKWTAREILCHLADCEIAFSFRWRQAIAETGHVIQPFNQEAWAESYGTSDGAQALEVFCVLRGWNLAFLKSQPVDVMTRAVNHPERGSMTFETLVQIAGGHDLNHLAQLQSIADQA